MGTGLFHRCEEVCGQRFLALKAVLLQFFSGREGSPSCCLVWVPVSRGPGRSGRAAGGEDDEVVADDAEAHGRGKMPKSPEKASPQPKGPL